MGSARLGKVTASRVADLMAKTKSGPSASRQNYMADLIVERLTGEQADHFQSAAMIWGRRPSLWRGRPIRSSRRRPWWRRLCSAPVHSRLRRVA